MSINFKSPSTLTTAFLVGDTIANPASSNDNLPTLTKVTTGPATGQPCCAAIEIQSTQGALLISRLNAPQFAAIANTAVDGMIVYRSDLGEFLMRQAGVWAVIESGTAGAPSNAFYVITQPTAALPNATVTNVVDTFGTTNNLFLGLDTPLAVTAGNSNTAVGVESEKNLTTGIGNTAIGFQSGGNVQAGSHNVFVGSVSGVGIINGSDNISIGYESNNVYTGSTSTAIGSGALFSNVNSPNNVAVGYLALNLTTGNNNTGIGFSVLALNTIGTNNTAVGSLALHASTGTDCTAIGAGALEVNTSASNNTAIGAGALIALNGALAGNNTALGAGALQTEQTGNANVAIGYQAFNLTNNILDANNVAIGASAGALRNNYISCTFLGASADAANAGLQNATAIGAGTQIALSNSINLGNACNVGINITNPSYTIDIGTVGGNSSVRMSTNAADPANPGAGKGVIFVDDTGALVYITPAGNRHVIQAGP